MDMKYKLGVFAMILLMINSFTNDFIAVKFAEQTKNLDFVKGGACGIGAMIIQPFQVITLNGQEFLFPLFAPDDILFIIPIFILVSAITLHLNLLQNGGIKRFLIIGAISLLIEKSIGLYLVWYAGPACTDMLHTVHELISPIMPIILAGSLLAVIKMFFGRFVRW